MISIEHASKSYIKKQPLAVNDLELELKDGEILGLVGLNGAGKTTTIRMSSGIILPTSGHIMVDGFDIVSEKVKAASNIGWIPELPNFEPNAKPFELMRYFAGFYGMHGDETDNRITELLEKVGLKGQFNKKLRNYSQGMKKRFAIAESIIGDPKNVLFDETLNGLDPEGVLFVRNLMFSLKKEGKAILLSSHILSEVEDVADRVAIIDHGKLIKLLNRGDLKTLGKTVIELDILNYDSEAAKLLQNYGELDKSDHVMVLRDLKVSDADIPSILSELVKANYTVKKFNPVGESLEDYFFSLIGGAK
jgi:ABC-2 type transport system ATP-binding protein